MIINKADASLDFGSVTLGAAGTIAFENVIDLGKTRADGCSVDIICTELPAGGTNVTMKLQGSEDPSVSSPVWADILISPTVVTADIKVSTSKRFMSLPVPRENGYRGLRVAVVSTGTYTAGKFSAALDTYKGE